MVEPSVPYPLFPPYELLNDHAQAELPINLEVRRRLEAVPKHLYALRAWRTGIDFLMKESRRSEFREQHYKTLCPIIESMMHWSWSIRGKALHDWKSVDAIAFMEFIMRPPITWVATPGHSRYSLKRRQNFQGKLLNPHWRPIVRRTLSGGDPGMGSYDHRGWFIRHGRKYFAFAILTASGTETENPFRDISWKDFDTRPQKRRAIFTSKQLDDLIGIAESLTNLEEKWEPFLFIFAVAIHTDIPMRALGATQTIKPTFSYFKARNSEASAAVSNRVKTDCANNRTSRPRMPNAPELFESPLYPGRQFAIALQFEPYFHRYAQFRHLHDQSLSSHSFVITLGHGQDAFGYSSLMHSWSAFTASILKELRASPASEWVRWKSSEKLDPNASLIFVELRESAKQAGLIPKAFVSQRAGKDANVWPDIGIRHGMSSSQWFHSHRPSPQ